MSSGIKMAARHIIDLRYIEDEDGDLHLDNTGCVITKTVLVAKIFSNRQILAKVVHHQLRQSWNIKGKFWVIDKKNNMLLIGFNFEEDHRRVLEGMRWLVANQHMTLKRCGRIDHTTRACSAKPREHEGLELEAEDSFGPWMHGERLVEPGKACKPAFVADSSDADGHQERDGQSTKAAESANPNPVKQNRKEWVTAVSKLVHQVDLESPTPSTAKKRSWKRLTQSTMELYQPTLADEDRDQ
ncbi:hypothetical protein Tsubulata_013664 [Turnera subulata]|uniref:DUF4283 domain-containing protein n=1 Tax=Turnera subulata TaxID=218843 RepID=A0A9Q0JAW9_9ROSI|nr:hypothetical protein Tsubulata_013664 [Turnera subulata]